VAVPEVIAVTSPVPASTDARAALLLLHTPPPGAANNVDTLPIQNDVDPVIAPGAAITVTVRVTLHPPPTEY
jgi:hypothetical protein